MPYVSLTHCVGLGTGADEVTWAGRPVLIMGLGGQRDFLPLDLAHLIDYRLVPNRDPFLDPDELVHRIGASWEAPDLVKAGCRTREVAANPAEARARGARLQTFVGE